MKIKKLVLAVAGALVASQAFATPVTQGDVVAARALTTSFKLKETWISGASAPTYNVYDGFRKGCDTGTLAIFSAGSTVAAPGGTGDYNAYACKRGGVVTVLYHTVAGGSFNAYTPHLPSTMVDPSNGALPARLQRVKDVGTASCDASVYTGTITGVPAGTPFYKKCTRGFAFAGQTTVEKKTATTTDYTVSSTTYTSLNDSAPSLPAGGFSDVEAALWGVTYGNAVATLGTESNTNVLQGFGVVVTTNLYRTLQVAQFGTANASGYGTVEAAAITDPSFDPANAPNLTSAQYRSIIADLGGYQENWNKLLGDTLGASKAIYLVKRVATSGTQASSNAHFLGNPCLTGPLLGSVAPATANNGSGFIVSQQSGTSGVKTQLESINAAGNFGIGVVSLENNPETYMKFVSLDGVHPELNGTIDGSNKARTQMTSGKYTFAMEMKTFIANTATADESALITAISATLSDPASCSDIGRGMAISTTGSDTCALGTYRSKATKQGNNCAPFQLFF